MIAAKISIGMRAFGHSAAIATAAAKAVVECPDGRLAYSLRHDHGI